MVRGSSGVRVVAMLRQACSGARGAGCLARQAAMRGAAAQAGAMPVMPLRLCVAGVSTSTLPQSTFKRKTPYKGDLFVPAPDLTTPPPLYEKFVRCLMYSGKKTTAEKILKKTLNMIKTAELERRRKERTDSIRNADPDADVQAILFEEAEHVDPMVIFREAVSNCMPTVALTPTRKGASVYQVPTPLDPRRRQALAIKWIIAAARKRTGKPMAEKLTAELMDAYHNQGTVIRRKVETHKMAEANRAYASMRWSR